ncbi:unnamed protein product [Hydatigera taeniaeformis]|uniref:AGC-kinase C-terminal domain-containing protein n=1 Tax=Hydatigena taeniaeformis TaxID=6205 RepID=A0A0R3XD84_HYDTA|nr:unnamed protein product [Hydatigera taeniaeformis]
MARSSTRDSGAESALALPPPPSHCTPSSKECRMAALAYAPCLPAADRLLTSSSMDTAKNIQSNFSSRRPSVLDMVRLFKKSPSVTTPPDLNAIAGEQLQSEGEDPMNEDFLSPDSISWNMEFVVQNPNIMANYNDVIFAS